MPIDPGYLPPLPAEQQRLREKCYHATGTFIPFPPAAIEGSILERFAQMVQLYPERLAVQGAQQALTYVALNQLANRLAHHLLTQQGEGQHPVALLFEHDALILAAMLGVLKAGKFYVPLDPAYPPARLDYLVHDAQTSLLITNTANLPLATALAQERLQIINVDTLSPHCATEDPRLSSGPDQLALLLYTSGSTGTPKGFPHPHRNVLHDCMQYTNAAHFCPDDRFVLLSSYSFADSVRTIYSALLNGAALYPFDLPQHGVAPLARWLNAHAITIYRSVPTVFRHFVRTLTGSAAFPAVRLLYLAGEPVYTPDVAAYRRHFAPSCLLVNRLGTGEALTFRCYFIDHDTPLTTHQVPVGYAVPDKEVLLLDDDGRTVADGESGEIAVRSRYLSPGYWHRPELTRVAFQDDAVGSGIRLYRTGDLGQMRPDGCLLHLGRKDFQVKIRGYRIEVAEIEHALSTLATVREAVVMASTGPAGDQRLVAYVVPAVSPAPTASVLSNALRAQLPAYMVPSAFMFLAALPLSPNGKVDRRALPAPRTARPPLDVPFVAASTPLETQLARLWAEVLGLDEIGIHDPFLELGGHSLLATQILSRVVATWQIDLPLSTLLVASTVAQMAMVIAQHQATQTEPHSVSRLLAEIEALAEDDVTRRLADEVL
jgi:amino acid adenylation domain-containing protein